MAKKEKCKFQIKLTIKEADGKLVKLNKKLYLEVTWEGNLGVLNPWEWKTYNNEWGNGRYRLNKGVKVQIKENGKRYDFMVKIHEIKKGWFYDKIRWTEGDGIIPAPNSNFTIVYPVNEDEKVIPGKPLQARKRMIWEKVPSEEGILIKPVQLRWEGPAVLGSSVLALIFVILLFWRSRKK